MLLLLGLGFGFTACAAPPFDAGAVAREWAAYMQRDYRLRPGDKLEVELPEVIRPSIEGLAAGMEVTVTPTGTVTLPGFESPLTVSGKTLREVRQSLLTIYGEDLTNPEVTVRLVEAAVQSVYVHGEVILDGPVTYTPGMTLMQAITVRGGLDITVKESDIYVLRIAPDGGVRRFRVNVSEILYGDSPDFLLLPGDVVHAQTSAIGELGNWVDLYIRRLLPFSVAGPAIPIDSTNNN